MVLVVGTLVGLEIPLVMRILKRNVALKDLVSQVLTFDYLGALAVSLAFPLLLVPQLGLIRTGLLFGLLNALVAVWALWLFRRELRRFGAHACGLLPWWSRCWLAALGGAEHITTLAEDKFYQDRIVFTAASPYQRIVVTDGKLGHRLFLNGNLQFAERDEYRYHEALVHPAMAAPRCTQARWRCWAAATAWRCARFSSTPAVESVTLVELDPAMTRLFTDNATLARLNGHALRSPKVQVVNTDAFQWLRGTAERRHFRCDRGGLPRPHQLLHWQALHQQLLRPARPAPGRQRLCRGADHVAPGGAPEFLDRGAAPSSRSACRRRPTMPMCPALANGALCWPATGPGACPRRCPAGCVFERQHAAAAV